MDTFQPATTTRVSMRALLVTACIAFSSTVAAQTCSGGPDGGMDATGNQCSAPALGDSTPVSGSGAGASYHGERHGGGNTWSESAGITFDAVSTTEPDSAAAVQTASARRLLRPLDAVIAP